MKIAVAQFYTSHVGYAKYTVEINRLYCEQHGYQYILENDTTKILNTLEGRSPTWYKPKLIQEVLSQTDVDYVLFLDIDAVINDHADKIENYISADHELVFTTDYGHHSVMNAGVFIVKNTEWVRNTMSTWWELGDTLRGDANPRLEVPIEWKDKPGYFRTGLWHDQTCLTYMHDTDAEFRNKTTIITNRKLNWKEPFDDNFVYHGFAYGNTPFRKLDYVYYTITKQPLPTHEGKTLVELGMINLSDKETFHRYYSRVYEKLFEPIKATVTSIMEIGVAQGYSLATWKDYFINSKIIGVDKDPNCGYLIRNEERISIVAADTGNVDDLLRLQQNYSNLDIILDDGGHRMDQQQLALAYLLPCLKQDGLYVLEDLHTSTEAKMPEKYIFNWGDPNKTTTLDMLRHFQRTGQIVSDYLTPEQCRYLENTIDTVTIFDELGEYTSITSVITKKPH